MSTAYTLDAIRAMLVVRRASLPLEPRTAQSSQRYITTLAKIVALSAASVVVAAALLLIHIDNQSSNDRGCTFSANLHNSLVRPHVPPLAIERDWHTHGLPVLSELTGTDRIATSSCDQGLNGRTVGSQIQQ